MTDAKARLLQMIADEPHMGGGGLLKAVGKAQKAAKATKEAETAAMRLYHGSPHVMLPTPENKLGKFDPTKMGTGEGGHMYGRGHYLAQSRDVAKNYRPRSPKYEDKLLQEYKKAQKANNYPKMEVLEDAMLHKDPDEILGKYSNAEDGYTPEHTKAAADYIKWYESNRPEVGGVYHVDLPQDYLANMLDYDKPINQHPAQVKALLEKAGINTDTSATAGSMIGGQEAHLAKHGIPGLHYDDTTGAGTRNFVVFPGNEDMLNIVQRDKKGGAVHMAGGGKPKPTAEELAAMRAKQFNVKDQIMLGNPNQFNKDRANQLYPKKETMNPIVKAAKDKLDQFNAFIDRGVPVKELVGGLTGAIPFVGPKLRKDLEGATVDFPLGFERLPGNEQVATGNIETAPAKVSDILDSLKMSDLTGGTGASNVLNSVGKGYMPDPLDLLDAATFAIPAYGIGKAGVKAGVKGAGALSNLAKSDTGYKLAQKALNYVPAAQPMNVVKDTGGNWRGGSVENQLGGLLKAENLDNPEQAKALNKWISSNLTNYVKKQMATPDDPVRKLAEQGITHKPSVLNDYQDAFAPREDRVKAGFPAEGLGQSQLARSWENASDDAITLHNAGEIQSAPQRAERMNAAKQKVTEELEALNQKFESRIRNSGLKENEVQNLMRIMTPTEKADMIGDDSFVRANADYLAQSNPVTALQAKIMEDNPWIAKVDPNSSVYSPHLSDLGFDHIVDVLKEDIATGRIRPEQLSKVSMEQAVRRTYEYDQELAAKMKAARASAREGLPVYKEYPEGFRWIQLNKPGAFTSESEAMGHSVRGYEPPKGHTDWTEGSGDSGSLGYGHGGWEAIKSGDAKVYSLVDKEGQPHVTVEVGKSAPDARSYSDLPTDVRDDISDQAMDALRSLDDPQIWDKHGNKSYYGHDKLDEIKENLAREWIKNNSSTSDRITQIKGKQNRAPKEDYLLFVQDFVKSGNWSDVGDIKNAGLRKTSDAFNENELNKIREAGIEVPAYATQEEIKFIGNQAFPGQYGDVPYAEGGAVSDAKQRLLDMIAEEPHMAGGGLLKAVAKAQKTAKAVKAAESALKIKPPSDNILNVRQANFQYPKTVGNQTVSIDKLSGGVRMTSASEKQRVNDLARKISSPEGYISRLIVDQNNNVIEGQHRLEALRQLGIKDVPVYKIEELADTMPVSKMEAAVQSVGSIHSDHVGQLVSHALEHIAEGGIDSARKMNYGKFQKHYDAALDAAVGMQQTLPAVEREANLAKMLEDSAAKKQLYHGTGRDIKEFDKSKLRRTAFGEGFHLAESPNLANFYANQFDEGQNVMPVHAAIKKPYELKNMHDWYDVPGDSDKDKTNFLKSQGYDGVKYPHGAGGDETSPSPNVYVAFEPTQIKSATGNRGTYDTTDPDINKAEGGEVHMVFGGLTKAKKIAKAAEATKKAAEAAAKAAKVVPAPAAPAFIPGLMQKSTATEIGREERARRQAAAAAEAARVAAAKQTPVPVGYVKHTEKSPNPHVGFRFEADQPVGIVPSPTLDVGALERSHKGASMLPIPWDSTNRNVRVSGVSGEKLAHDIWSHGGFPYSGDEEHLIEKIGGASGRGIAKRIQGREMAARAENKQAGGTGEIIHAVNTMGVGSENYALPSSEFAVDIIGRRFMNGKISLNQAEDLANTIRNYVDPDTKKQPFKNWAGFLSRDGVQQIYTGEGLNGPPGDLRKLIAKNIIYSKKNQELLDFNAEDFVNAITHEPLRGVGRGYIGGNLLSNVESSPMKLSPTADYPWLNPYDTNFSATHIGQLEDLVPIQAVMGRKIAPIEQGLLAKQAAKVGGKPYTDASLQGSAIGALEQRKENVAQFMDSRYFQDLADYFEALKTPLEKKKGGLARTKKVKRHGNTVSN